MHIFDITGLIEEAMWAYDPPVMPPTVEHIASVDGPTGWDAHSFTLCTLTGTYLEASAHLFHGGETIDQVAPDRFVCPATILHLPECAPGYAITPADLEGANASPQPGDAVLVATGWDRMWNRPGYVENSPHFTPAAMEWLINTGAVIIGGDMPCFDNPARPAGVNQLLFGAGCLILAPLVRLNRARMPRPLLIALPLRIKGVCGAPCRAILMEQSPDKQSGTP